MVRLGKKCASGIFWCFFKQDYPLFSSNGATHGDVSFRNAEHTMYTLWQNISAYWSCIAIFLAEVYFVCLKEASHRDVSFEHTEHTIRFGKKLVRIGVYCYFPSRSMSCLLKRGVSSRRFF